MAMANISGGRFSYDFLSQTSTQNSVMMNELNGYDTNVLIAILNSGQGERVKNIAREILRQRYIKDSVAPTGPAISYPNHNFVSVSGNYVSEQDYNYNIVSGTYADIRGTYADKSGTYEPVEPNGNEIMLTRPITNSVRDFQLERQVREKMRNPPVDLSRQYNSIRAVGETKTPEINLAKPNLSKPKPINKLLEVIKSDGAKAKVKIVEIMTEIKAEVKRDFADPFIAWLKKK